LFRAEDGVRERVAWLGGGLAVGYEDYEDGLAEGVGVGGLDDERLEDLLVQRLRARLKSSARPR
jgi:hypothetical protein